MPDADRIVGARHGAGTEISTPSTRAGGSSPSRSPATGDQTSANQSSFAGRRGTPGAWRPPRRTTSVAAPSEHEVERADDREHEERHELRLIQPRARVLSQHPRPHGAGTEPEERVSEHRRA